MPWYAIVPWYNNVPWYAITPNLNNTKNTVTALQPYKLCNCTSPLLHICSGASPWNKISRNPRIDIRHDILPHSARRQHPHAFYENTKLQKFYLSWSVALNDFFSKTMIISIKLFKIKGVLRCFITCIKDVVCTIKNLFTIRHPPHHYPTQARQPHWNCSIGTSLLLLKEGRV